MKLLLNFVLALVTVTTFAQKTFQGKATYMSKTSMDMSRFGDQISAQQKERMMARFKSFLEKTYTLSFNKTESSFKENASLEAPGTSGPRFSVSNGQGSVYKNLKDKELIEDVEQFGKRFLVVEKMEQPKWQLSAETKKIGNYTCYKATLIKEDTSVDFASIFSRRRNNQEKDSINSTKKEEARIIEVTAWYSPQLPVSVGPAEYWGLPGLILELNAGRTTMLCTEIAINTEEEIEIVKPTKGEEVSRDEYNKIVKIKTEELRERFRGRGGEGRDGRGRGGRRF